MASSFSVGWRLPSVPAIVDAPYGLVPLEPPSRRRCWLDVGRLLPRVFPHHEAIGLARLQNDLLLALTARDTGAVFVTSHPHFAALRRHVPFAVKLLAATARFADRG